MDRQGSHTRAGTGSALPGHSAPQCKTRPEKRHIQFQPLPRNEKPLHMKMVYARTQPEKEDKQLKRVQDVPSTEYDFHKTQMGLKQRLPDLLCKRNQMSYTSLGDKPYKAVERSDEFYRNGGLISGSTNVARLPHQNRQSSNDFATVGSYEATNPVRMRWADRKQTELQREDYETVESLSKWERTTLNEVHPGLPMYDSSDDEQ